MTSQWGTSTDFGEAGQDQPLDSQTWAKTDHTWRPLTGTATIRARWRCGKLSNYFKGAHQTNWSITKVTQEPWMRDLTGEERWKPDETRLEPRIEGKFRQVDKRYELTTDTCHSVTRKRFRPSKPMQVEDNQTESQAWRQTRANQARNYCRASGTG